MSDEKTEKPVEVIGITASDYNVWKTHPVTQAFRRYLREYVAALEQAHVARWRGGDQDDKQEAWASGQVQAIEEMSILEFEDIAAFYATAAEEEDDDDQHYQSDYY